MVDDKPTDRPTNQPIDQPTDHTINRPTDEHRVHRQLIFPIIDVKNSFSYISLDIWYVSVGKWDILCQVMWTTLLGTNIVQYRVRASHNLKLNTWCCSSKYISKVIYYSRCENNKCRISMCIANDRRTTSLDLSKQIKN